MSREFVNGPRDRGSIPGRVIPKTQKMVLDAALLSTQNYKERIKSKVEQSREWSSALPYISGHTRLRSLTLLLLTHTPMYTLTHTHTHTHTHIYIYIYIYGGHSLKVNFPKGNANNKNY